MTAGKGSVSKPQVSDRQASHGHPRVPQSRQATPTSLRSLLFAQEGEGGSGSVLERKVGDEERGRTGPCQEVPQACLCCGYFPTASLF